MNKISDCQFCGLKIEFLLDSNLEFFILVILNILFCKNLLGQDMYKKQAFLGYYGQGGKQTPVIIKLHFMSGKNLDKHQDVLNSFPHHHQQHQNRGQLTSKQKGLNYKFTTMKWGVTATTFYLEMKEFFACVRYRPLQNEA